MAEANHIPLRKGFQDITGKKFGLWTAVSYAGKRGSGAILWNCVCDCGQERVVDGSSLRTGASKSCGCIHGFGRGKRQRRKALPIPFTADEIIAAKCFLGIDGEIRNIIDAQGYAVSDCGRVISKVKCTWRNERFRELKAWTNTNGYKMVHVNTTSGPKLRLVHQIVANAFLPEDQNKPFCLHNDGNPQNNHVSNIRRGTQKENMEDMVRHGRSQRGEKSKRSKLTESRVRLIRALSEEGFKHNVIGDLFGISRGQVGRIVERIDWEHVV